MPALAALAAWGLVSIERKRASDAAGTLASRSASVARIRSVASAGVLVLGITVSAGCHGCEFCLPGPGTQQAAGAGAGHITVGAPAPAEAARAERFAGKRPGRAPCTHR